MKTTVILFLSLITGIIGMAQEESKENKQSTEEYRTLFSTGNSNKEITHGGYGAVLFNYSKIDGKDAFLAGMRGMWIINHGLGLGVGGYGFVNDLEFDSQANYPYEENSYFLAGGYGGLVIEPIVGAKHPVHVSFPVLIGAGGVAYIRDYWTPYPQYPDTYNYYTEDATAYFVLEPGIEVEFNMVKFFRIGLGAYYRYTSNINLTTWNGDEYTEVSPDLKGFSFGLSLKFGKF
jgi:hypothetical protein